MNKLTTIALTTITALATTAPGAMAESNYSHHVLLGQVVSSTGIEYKINPVECWEKNAMGWYWAYNNEFVVCQENKRSVGVEVNWTEEDLDTVRHEAQHLIQDCIDGSRQGALSSVYKDVPGLVKSVLSTNSIRSIIHAYSDQSEHIISMELEAFAVASMNKPLEQVSDIKHYCL